MPIFSCEEAKRTDIVSYLESVGHHPLKVRNNDYWYLSPFREENAPSFKVNRKINVWYDHGIGKGGNFIDFGILYHKCAVSEFLKLLNNYPNQLSFHQHNCNSQAGVKAANEKEKIRILATRPVASAHLQNYLHSRLISVKIANQYCREVDFELYGKKHTVIGFQNNSGGYELRSYHFKGSSSPKDVTLINQNSDKISVFEGFFSFLSFQTIHQGKAQEPGNFLVLNSLAFFDKSRSVMERHEVIDLFLDRDIAGMDCTKKALTISTRYTDKSGFYQPHKDLNEWLMKRNHGQSKFPKTRMHL